MRDSSTLTQNSRTLMQHSPPSNPSSLTANSILTDGELHCPSLYRALFCRQSPRLKLRTKLQSTVLMFKLVCMFKQVLVLKQVQTDLKHNIIHHHKVQAGSVLKLVLKF
ncbi:hypothetical protein LOK49_LG11G02874 [Camellia lanceoleosa]|uniref:Uncharacterized protein n=1 Tax=Camellia lanceoleosa TaxID=1840588 RepID=A0ACC0G5T1_9ERIC|nr:hypothetical protein LOK49_LG11G02874 [Camellia lanceoleosa]